MAFDKDRHEFDKRGFMVEKDTKQVAGQFERWFVKREDEGSPYPKWVKPHKSLVDRSNDRVHVPLWPEYFVDVRTKEPFVLVHDEVEEEKATHRDEEEKKSKKKKKDDDDIDDSWRRRR